MSDNRQNTHAQNPVVFVGGAPRSGTTVTHALLCTSAKANDYCPEVSFLRPIVNAYAVGMRNWDDHTRAFFRTHEDFRQHMVGHVEHSLALISKVMGNPQVLTVKDPLMTPLFYWLHRLMGPKARFVTVVRNPNDVVRSRQEVLRKMGRPFTPAVAREIASEYMQSYAHLNVDVLREAVFALRYDDLTDEGVLAQLRAFTGLDDIDVNNVWAEQNAVTTAAASNPWFSPKYRQPINMENRLSPLAPEFADVVSEVCAPLMQRFGWA